MAHLIAEFYSPTKTKSACVDLSTLENGRRSLQSSQPVSGKREAREYAKRHNATPWNF